MLLLDLPEQPVGSAAYDVTFQDALDYTGLTRDTLWAWLRSTYIPYTRKDRRKVYIPESYVKWLKKFLQGHVQVSSACREYDLVRSTLNRRITKGVLPVVRVGEAIYLERKRLEAVMLAPAGDRHLITREVAALLSLSPKQVYGLNNRGELIAHEVKSLRGLRFLESEVLAFKKARERQSSR